MNRKELAEKMITERIDQILSKCKQKNEQLYKEQAAILSTLDSATRRQFEDFAESLGEWNTEEQMQVYKAAFYDGLRLAHKAFR